MTHWLAISLVPVAVLGVLCLGALLLAAVGLGVWVVSGKL